MMSLITMSKYPLSLICGYPFREGTKWNERPPGREARIGTMVHKLAEAHITKQPWVEKDVDAEEFAEAWGIFTGPFQAWLDKTKWESELGVVYDARTDTAKLGPRRGEPGYDQGGANILRGTLDLVSQWRDDSDRLCLDVVDIKTGKTQNAHDEQLTAQAVAVSRLYDPHLVRVGFVFPRKTKVIEPEWRVLTRDDLDAEAGRIAKTLRKLPVAQPVSGDHCTYRCPLGRAQCPAWTIQDEKVA